MTSPLDPHTKMFSHINGGLDELVDRLAITELCKGWPVYRDASEWQNYRDLFADVATVWTTWSGARSVDEFIEISKNGKGQGVFIMHRECGTLAELGSGPNRRRGLGKMKATITHRFRDANSGEEYDVDCDCRFIFFCEKLWDARSGQPAWKARYVKLFYEKDKVVRVDGRGDGPMFRPEELAGIPEGYKYLGAAQARLGYKIDFNLATARNHLQSRMYMEMEKWLEGQEVDLEW